MFWIRAIVQPTSTSTNAPLEADQVLQALINPGIYSPPPKAFSERPSKKKVDAWRFTQQNEFMDLKLLVISELNLRQDQKKVEMASSLNETPKRAVHRLKEKRYSLPVSSEFRRTVIERERLNELRNARATGEEILGKKRVGLGLAPLPDEEKERVSSCGWYKELVRARRAPNHRYSI